MTDSVARAKRLVARVVAWQIASALLAALVFWGLSGGKQALAAFAGGASIAIGSGLLGWRAFAPGVAAAPVLNRALLAGEMLKWLWLICAVWLSFAVLRLAPLPFILGLVGAQIGYWFAMVLWKQD